MAQAQAAELLMRLSPTLPPPNLRSCLCASCHCLALMVATTRAAAARMPSALAAMPSGGRAAEWNALLSDVHLHESRSVLCEPLSHRWQ